MVKLLDLQAITMQHGDEYKAAANRVIESGWFLQGNENKQFEKDYAQYIGTDECVAVANGLDALRLIIRGYKELGIFQKVMKLLFLLILILQPFLLLQRII